MIKRREGQGQGAIDQDLAGGGGEQVGTANDLGDLHRGIVSHASKLV